MIKSALKKPPMKSALKQASDRFRLTARIESPLEDMENSNNKNDDDMEHEEADDSSSRLEDLSTQAGDLAEETDAIRKLASSETRQIRFWRAILVVLVLGIGAILSTFTYRVLVSEQNSDLDNAIGRFKDTIAEVTTERVQTLFESLRYLGQAIPSFALENADDNALPLVAMPRFEVLARHTRKLTGLEMIMYNPLIPAEQKEEWEDFAWNHQEWIANSREILATEQSPGDEDAADGLLSTTNNNNITREIFEFDDAFLPTPPPPDREWFAPVWMQSPPPLDASMVQNLNQLFFESTQQAWTAMQATRDIVLAPVVNVEFWTDQVWSEQFHANFHAPHAQSAAGMNFTVSDRPHLLVHSPVYADNNANANDEMVGFFTSILAFDVYLSRLVPNSVQGIMAVLKNSCGQAYSYKLHGDIALYLGPDDFHDAKYNDKFLEVPFEAYLDPNRTTSVPGHCLYWLALYPTDKFAADYLNDTPRVFAFVVAAGFLIMTVAFLVYDSCVRRRNTKVVREAAKTNAVVSRMFPSNVRDRVLNDATARTKGKSPASARKLNAFLKLETDFEEKVEAPKAPFGDDDLVVFQQGTPIAELFPEATIMFADIAGFTAWSSTREPSQVFLLLETLYRSFDKIARKRKVFKVETVGDCYVAVSGLPDRNPNHAVAMARFSRDCLCKIELLMKKLEVILGPDTGELTMRFGLHSGPVTAGVLRGERSRFQLFGDTVNTAARMESHGSPGRIQVSQETHDLLVEAGKSAWLTKRDDVVNAKGKGRLKTYWLAPEDGDTASAVTHLTEKSRNTVWEPLKFDVKDPTNKSFRKGKPSKHKALPDKVLRLVEWNVDILTKLLRQLVANRDEIAEDGCSLHDDEQPPLASILHEVTGTLPIKEDDNLANDDKALPELNLKVSQQLRNFVCSVAGMYGDNAFHNFEHASHVLLSVVKLMARLKTDDEGIKSAQTSKKQMDRSFGIVGDSMAQFAAGIAALIHDVYHPGVPNSQLVKEGSQISIMYSETSIAEQHSFNVAWALLQGSEFDELRSAIYPNQEEKGRFRQFVVNFVMATDIMDNYIRRERQDRWEQAFKKSTDGDSSKRRATVVLDHLIQASDVSHCMQHWHVYRKWNEKLFIEMYLAYLDGRASKDPATFWYRSELGFFDLYVIPLANKLVDSKAFGVSGEEYLKFALGNREEWQERGQRAVKEMMARIRSTGVIDLVEKKP